MENDNKIKEKLRERLREIRKARNLSIDELAKALEMPVRTIKSYDQKERLPSAVLFLALNEKLNINLNWFANGSGSMFTFNKKNMPLEELINQRYNLSEKEMGLVKNILDFLDND